MFVYVLRRVCVLCCFISPLHASTDAMVQSKSWLTQRNVLIAAGLAGVTTAAMIGLRGYIVRNVNRSKDKTRVSKAHPLEDFGRGDTQRVDVPAQALPEDEQNKKDAQQLLVEFCNSDNQREDVCVQELSENERVKKEAHQLVELCRRGKQHEDARVQALSEDERIKEIEALLNGGLDPDTSILWGEIDDIALHRAMINGFCKIRDLLIRRGASPNTRTSRLKHKYAPALGATPLLLACHNKWFDVALAMVPACTLETINMATETHYHLGDDYMTIIRDNWHHTTALHYAVDARHIVLAQALLTKKADVNIRPLKDDQPPLTTACLNGHADMARLLLEHKANVGPQWLPDRESKESKAEHSEEELPYWVALHYACKGGSVDVVQAILDAPGGQETIDMVARRTFWRDDALMRPVECALSEAKPFVAQGPIAEYEWFYHKAKYNNAARNALKVITLLTERGAQVTTSCLADIFTICCNRDRHYEDEVCQGYRKLLEHWVYEKDVDATQCLWQAVRADDPAAVDYAIDTLKASVTARDSEGNTPLHTLFLLKQKLYVEQVKHFMPIVSSLIRARADIDAQNHDGQTLFMTLASSVHHTPWMKRLIALGANRALLDKDRHSFAWYDQWDGYGPRTERLQELRLISARDCIRCVSYTEKQQLLAAALAWKDTLRGCVTAHVLGNDEPLLGWISDTKAASAHEVAFLRAECSPALRAQYTAIDSYIKEREDYANSASATPRARSFKDIAAKKPVVV